MRRLLSREPAAHAGQHKAPDAAAARRERDSLLRRLGREDATVGWTWTRRPAAANVRLVDIGHEIPTSLLWGQTAILPGEVGRPDQPGEST